MRSSQNNPAKYGLKFAVSPRHCPTCKKHVEATKTLELWDLPRVIIFQLKRFSSPTDPKIEDLVTFPLTDLDMAPHVLRSQE